MDARRDGACGTRPVDDRHVAAAIVRDVGLVGGLVDGDSIRPGAGRDGGGGAGAVDDRHVVAAKVRDVGLVGGLVDSNGPRGGAG